jgi:hypothetical protein
VKTETAKGQVKAGTGRGAGTKAPGVCVCARVYVWDPSLPALPPVAPHVLKAIVLKQSAAQPHPRHASTHSTPHTSTPPHRRRSRTRSPSRSPPKRSAESRRRKSLFDVSEDLLLWHEDCPCFLLPPTFIRCSVLLEQNHTCHAIGARCAACIHVLLTQHTTLWRASPHSRSGNIYLHMMQFPGGILKSGCGCLLQLGCQSACA